MILHHCHAAIDAAVLRDSLEVAVHHLVRYLRQAMPVTMVAVYVSLQDFAAPLIKIYSQGVCGLLRYDAYVVVSHIGPSKVLSVGVPQ